jgi:ribosomal protein L7/L12
MKDNVELEKEVIEAIHQGQTVTAIKILRAKRGIGLKESKLLVDAYKHQHPDIEVNLQEKNNSKVVLYIIAIAAFVTYLHFSGNLNI